VKLEKRLVALCGKASG